MLSAEEFGAQMNAAGISLWVTVLKDALTGIAAIAAAWLGRLGLKTWERQLLGTADHEESRRFLRATYRLREAIQRLREPFMSTAEMAAATKAAGFDPDTTDSNRSTVLAYEARWKRLRDAYVEFDAEMLEAEALWGPEVRKCDELLDGCLNRLQRSVQKLPVWHHKKLDTEAEQKLWDVISDSGDTSTFSAELKSAFQKIETVIRPHLKPYSSK
jgi:hypothetical protein